jgi:hypothetical protein
VKAVAERSPALNRLDDILYLLLLAKTPAECGR